MDESHVAVSILPVSHSAFFGIKCPKFRDSSAVGRKVRTLQDKDRTITLFRIVGNQITSDIESHLKTHTSPTCTMYNVQCCGSRPRVRAYLKVLNQLWLSLSSGNLDGRSRSEYVWVISRSISKATRLAWLTKNTRRLLTVWGLRFIPQWVSIKFRENLQPPASC